MPVVYFVLGHTKPAQLPQTVEVKLLSEVAIDPTALSLEALQGWYRKTAWRVAVAKLEERHGLSAEMVASLEEGQDFFFSDDPPDTQDVLDPLLARDLNSAAKRIRDTGLVFVMTEDTPPALVGKLAANVANQLKGWPVDRRPAWSFVSMPAVDSRADKDRQARLDVFITALHSEMLPAESSKDLSDALKKAGPVLLCGPTGSGKSYAVRKFFADKANPGGALPEAPRHRLPPLVEVNLAAVNENLLESRIRGYAAGTFSGADRKGRAGWFEEANNGVLFLDEFQSVSLAAQVQLMDVLNAVSDDIFVARMGEDHERKRFNVRVILAVNEDIDTLIQEKRLRKDLYYRVRTVVSLPSLQARLEQDAGHRDLHGLLLSYRWKSLGHFEWTRLASDGEDRARLERCLFPRFTAAALARLARHPWGGEPARVGARGLRSVSSVRPLGPRAGVR